MAGYSGAAEGSAWDPREQLAWRNRRILSERQGWPAGALTDCEFLEGVFPRWSTTWRFANRVPGFERPAGFYAQEWPYTGHYPRVVYAVTAELLAAVLAQTTPSPNNR